jgi:hypothetical protein
VVIVAVALLADEDAGMVCFRNSTTWKVVEINIHVKHAAAVEALAVVLEAEQYICSLSPSAITIR